MKINAAFDAKQALTFVAACSCDGSKMPLGALAKRKTEICEESCRGDKRLRSVIASSFLFDHTENGWSNHEFARRYLKLLSEHLGERKLFAIWDLDSSYRKDIVFKEYAIKHDIHLSYIPAGQTRYWQPLDLSIFGPLEKKTDTELERLALKKGLGQIDIIYVLVTLVNVWKSLKPEKV